MSPARVLVIDGFNEPWACLGSFCWTKLQVFAHLVTVSCLVSSIFQLFTLGSQVSAIQSTHDIYEIQLQISLVISFSTKLVSDVTSEYEIRYHKGVALGD